MAGNEEDGTFHTTSEESQRMAEAAFGGATSDAPVVPSSTPTVSTPTAAPTGVPGVPRKRRFPRGLFVAFILFDVVIAIGIGAFFLIKGATESDSSSTPSFSVPAIPGAPTIPEIPSTPDEPATASAPSDLFSAAGLRAAKAQAQRLAGGGARIQLARIAQDQLQVIARNGSRGKVVLISPAITRAIDTPAGALTGNEFGFGSLDPAVAPRLTRAISRRYHVAPGAIDYMVVLRNPVDKKLEWLVYPRGGGGHFEANSRGGSLRRVG
jgi:hypothetical protein